MNTGGDWYRDEERLLNEVRRGERPKAVPDMTETIGSRGTPGPLPKRIGRFHIKKAIGSGGMGTVYEAVQEHPRRTVAVKVMRQGIASRSAMRRFEYESQVLARLRHSNIAQVYEAGTHVEAGAPGEPVPYFAMEYIPNARPITNYAKDKKLGTRQRLQLFAQVCDAVHHGHQKGVIHRDLKPSNILVDSEGQVKIIDFGVARGTDSDLAVTTLQTDVGQLIGTLQYMSPEQCEADPHDIDTRSDVYALGVVLFELLSGRLPYDVHGAQIYEATRVIREQQPTKLTTIDRKLRSDVETIVLKALEKDRQRRYQTALELAHDIQRYLAGRAIIARPPSLMYQIRVFARRNRVVVGAVAVVFVVLVAGVVVSSWQAVRATRAEGLARERLTEARRQAKIAEAVNRFLNDDLLAAVDPSRTPNREITMREVLDAASKRIEGKFEDEPLVEASIRSTIGETYANLGLYEAAEPHLREAEAIHVRELGADDPVTLQTWAGLADFLRRQGWFLQAESLARQTLEAQRRLLGADHPDTVYTRNALGLVLQGQGKLEEAERVFRQVLEIRRRTLGDRHPDTLVSMGNLAKAFERLVWWPDLAKGSGDVGKCEELAALHRQSLQAQRLVLGDEHPQTLASMGALGLALGCLGRTAEGEAMLRHALDTQRRVLGPEHPDTLQSMYNLAGVLRHQGRLDEAEELLKSVLEAGRRSWGVAHLSVASTTDFLLRVLRARAKLEEARPYIVRLNAEVGEGRFEDIHANPYGMHALAYALLTYEPTVFRDPVQALPLAEKAVELGANALPDLRVLAIAYEANGRLDDAVKTLREALTQIGPGDAYWRAVIETRLVHALRSNGDVEGAEQVLREAVGRTRTVDGDPVNAAGTELGREMIDLAVFLVAKGRFLQHEWFCGEVAEVSQGRVPKGGPGIAGFVVIYASALVQQGHYAEAEPYLRHCLRIRELALPAGNWRIPQVMSALGASLAGQEKFDEAEPLLLDGCEGVKKSAEAPKQQVDEAIQRLIDLYEAWGRPNRASEWRLRLRSGE